MKARRLVVAAVAALLVCMSAACQFPPRTRYVNSVFPTVDSTLGVVYRHTTTSTGAPIDLTMDIYQPSGDTATKRPVVMWMFGGYWLSGNTSQMSGYAIDSAQRGYVGISMQYRVRPAGGDLLGRVEDAYDDSIAAVDWLKANAATYRIDPAAIVVGGFSAGAVNALNVLYWPGRRGPATSPAAGAVSISGTATVAPTGARPPAIMFHGTADQTVSFASGKKICDLTVAAGNICQLVSYQGGHHDIVTLQAADIRARAAQFVFEQVLRPRGYPVVVVP
jgi:acetyl esterase/lipase